METISINCEIVFFWGKKKGKKTTKNKKKNNKKTKKKKQKNKKKKKKKKNNKTININNLSSADSIVLFLTELMILFTRSFKPVNIWAGAQHILQYRMCAQR